MPSKVWYQIDVLTPETWVVVNWKPAVWPAVTHHGPLTYTGAQLSSVTVAAADVAMTTLLGPLTLVKSRKKDALLGSLLCQFLVATEIQADVLPAEIVA